MPNQDDSIILAQAHTAPAADYSYGMISGISSERSHKSQLIFLYRYPALGDGTLVDDVVWNNWYDPYIIPENVITLDQTIKTTIVGDTTTVTVTAANGTPYNMPAFDLSGTNIYEIQRSQDVDSRIVTWASGSRVTSEGLNNSVDQLFKSIQELNARTVALEGGETQGDGGGGATLPPGDYGDIVVNIDGSITVVDDLHNHVIANVDGLQAALDSKVDASGAAAAAPVQDIVAGTNVTVSDNGLGVYTINSSGGGGSAELTTDLVITDPVGPDQTIGQTYTTGTSLEVIVRDMLVSYQVPDVSNISTPNPAVVEHGTALSFSTVSFTTVNPSNINTGVLGGVIYTDPLGSNDASNTFTHNGTTSQTVSLSVSDTLRVATTNAGASGTAKQQTGYTLQVTGQDTQGSNFERTEAWTVRFRRYFGTSATEFNGSNGSTIISDMDTNGLSSDSKGTYTCPSNAATVGQFTYFVVPTCHFDDISSIVLNGSIPSYGAFSNEGTQVINTVEYTFFKSNADGAFNSGDTLVVS